MQKTFYPHCEIEWRTPATVDGCRERHERTSSTRSTLFRAPSRCEYSLLNCVHTERFIMGTRGWNSAHLLVAKEEKAHPNPWPEQKMMRPQPSFLSWSCTISHTHVSSGWALPLFSDIEKSDYQSSWTWNKSAAKIKMPQNRAYRCSTRLHQKAQCPNHNYNKVFRPTVCVANVRSAQRP